MHQVLLFSNNKIFNAAINDLFINTQNFQLNIFDQFLSNKEKISLGDSDVPMLFCSDEKLFEDFKLFLKRESFKNTSIVFNAIKDDKNDDKNRTLFFDLPLNLDELFHVIKNLTDQTEEAEYENIKFKKLILDMTAKYIKDSQSNIKLTDKEAKILWHLVKGKGSNVSQNFLLKKVWGYKEDIETKTLTTHIYTIRKKVNNFRDIFSIENSEKGYFIKFK